MHNYAYYYSIFIDMKKSDILEDYHNNHGLREYTTIDQIETFYINIDSSKRNTEPKLITNHIINLSNNPLVLYQQNQNLYTETYLKIYTPSHDYIPNDRLMMIDVKNNKKILRTYDDNNISPFIFVSGNEYLKISHASISISNIDIYTPNVDDDLYVEIDGFVGESVTNPYIGNIPINTLNKKHKVYFVLPFIAFDPKVIYIKLPNLFANNTSSKTYIFPTAYNVTITYLYSAGVPNNMLNANYPINANHISGYHTVYKVETDYIHIKLTHSIGSTNAFGGSEIKIAKIKEIIDGDIYPNEYTVYLPKPLTNIVSACIISSEIPNAEKVVRTKTKKNNAFYWENVADGNYVYKVELTEGNYSPSDIATELQTLILNTPRVNYSSSNNSYTNNNIISVTTNTNTDVVTFKSSRQALLQQPIVGLSPDISSVANINDPISVTVELKHANHGLTVGTTITIQGAVAHQGISETLLNQTHTITAVGDINTYSILLSNFNLSTTRLITKGGNAVVVYVPNQFRIRNDFNDSVCGLLGFRNIGTDTSITYYSSVITNADPYETEITTDKSGNSNTIKNNVMYLSGHNYILLVCPELGKMISGDINNIFGKILLSGIPSKTLFNTFVDTKHEYIDMIEYLNKLRLKWLDPDGNLYDFNGTEHSFTLKIECKVTYPKGTGINTNTGDRFI